MYWGNFWQEGSFLLRPCLQCLYFLPDSWRVASSRRGGKFLNTERWALSAQHKLLSYLNISFPGLPGRNPWLPSWPLWRDDDIRILSAHVQFISQALFIVALARKWFIPASSLLSPTRLLLAECLFIILCFVTFLGIFHPLVFNLKPTLGLFTFKRLGNWRQGCVQNISQAAVNECESVICNILDGELIKLICWCRYRLS